MNVRALKVDTDEKLEGALLLCGAPLWVTVMLAVGLYRIPVCIGHACLQKIKHSSEETNLRCLFEFFFNL